MKKHSEETPDWNDQRKRIIGLGESSIRKNYFPELQQKILELEKKNKDLNAAYEDLSIKEEELRQNYEELVPAEGRLRESEEKYPGCCIIFKRWDCYYPRRFSAVCQSKSC